MFHLISGVMHQASELQNDDGPLAIASLDVKNAFNTISRANIAKALLHCCWNNVQTYSSSQAEPEPFKSRGHDFLWKHFQGHYGPDARGYSNSITMTLHTTS